MTRRIAVVSAGLGTPPVTRLLADRLGAAALAAVGDAGLDVIELRALARPLADALVTGFPSGDLRVAAEAAGAADAVLAVTPVFTASYSGLFKTFVDVPEPDALVGTPVLIAATAGSARHSLVLEHALRPLFAYLRAVVLPTGVFAAPEDWAGGSCRPGSSGPPASSPTCSPGGRRPGRRTRSPSLRSSPTCSATWADGTD